MALFFIASKNLGEPPRFCLARISLARISIARVVVVVVKIFSTPENISSSFCFALYFRVQRCPACNVVRRARRKYSEKRSAPCRIFFPETQNSWEEKNDHHDRVHKLP